MIAPMPGISLAIRLLGSCWINIGKKLKYKRSQVFAGECGSLLLLGQVRHLLPSISTKKAAGYATLRILSWKIPASCSTVSLPCLLRPSTTKNRADIIISSSNAYGPWPARADIFFPLSNIPGQYFVHSSVSFPAGQLLYFNSMSLQDLIEQKMKKDKKRKSDRFGLPGRSLFTV